MSHVTPSEKIPEKTAPKPSPLAEEPKVESTKVAEKPKASSLPPRPTKQPTKEPHLPPKDWERRVCKVCHLFYTSIVCLSFFVRELYIFLPTELFKIEEINMLRRGNIGDLHEECLDVIKVTNWVERQNK